MRRAAFIAGLLFLVRVAGAEGTNMPAPAPPPDTGKSAAAKSSAKAAHQTTVQMQETIDKLAQSNRDLLDLLKQQQAILQDIQYDRRLQSRRLQDLEERLTQANQQNAQLQAKVASLAADAAVRPSYPGFVPSAASTNAIASAPPPAATTNAPPAAKVDEAPAATEQPATYLPPAPSEPAAGTKGWHRILALKGEENKQTDVFEIRGHAWRVVWHNLDKPGKLFLNTSALFINAFPKDDTIPQKVSAKLGTGGDATTLQGPGYYYLKIEASGGSWEAAVEDYR